MDLVLKYLENSAWFKNLAALEQDPTVRADLEKQAEAYYEMAEKRAKGAQPAAPRSTI